MIYLDNSATTKPDENVLESFIEVNKRYFANPASIHSKGREAEDLLEKARAQIQSILKAETGEIIFTSGGTEANNLAIIGLAQAFRNRGNHIITTEIEHPSVLQACRSLEKNGFEVDYLQVNHEGVISIDELSRRLRKDTILVSIMHVNNEIGAMQPIAQCSKLIHAQSRAVFHSDCVQSFGKVPVFLDENGPDAVTISAHKINGLKNSGLLALKKGLRPIAINYGGGQENGYRSGTVSVPNAVALAKAMRLSEVTKEQSDFRVWRNRLVEFCEQYNGIKVLSPENAAPHILSIAFEKIKGEVAVNYFQENGIMISTSSACSSKNSEASPVIEAIGLENRYKFGVIRMSFGRDNSEQDIAEVEKTLEQFMQMLGRGKTDGME